MVMEKETLEEAAEHNYPGGDVWTEEQAVIRRLAFKNGANWQAERMYSEEDIEKAHFAGKIGRESFSKWFEQFKKK